MTEVYDGFDADATPEDIYDAYYGGEEAGWKIKGQCKGASTLAVSALTAAAALYLI